MGTSSLLRRWGRRLIAGLLAGFIGIGCFGCAKPTEPKPLISEPQSEPNRLASGLEEVSPPQALEVLRQLSDVYNPQVRILSPRPEEVISASDVKVRFQVRGLPIYKDEDWQLGPHLHVFLDDQPYQAVYDLSEPLELQDLAPGTHTLRVFASRPWHESFKNVGAFDQRTFHVFAQTPQKALQGNQPLLTYSRPQGTYGAEPIMLDFYLTNAPLHLIAQEDGRDDISDWRIRCTVNGQSFVFDQWQPIYLKGFKPGKNWVQLELIDEAGQLIPNTFNNTVRVIEYEPGGNDSLARLVREELTAVEVASIIDPTYVPAAAEEAAPEEPLEAEPPDQQEPAEPAPESSSEPSAKESTPPKKQPETAAPAAPEAPGEQPKAAPESEAEPSTTAPEPEPEDSQPPQAPSQPPAEKQPVILPPSEAKEPAPEIPEAALEETPEQAPEDSETEPAPATPEASEAESEAAESPKTPEETTPEETTPSPDSPAVEVPAPLSGEASEPAESQAPSATAGTEPEEPGSAPPPPDASTQAADEAEQGPTSKGEAPAPEKKRKGFFNRFRRQPAESPSPSEPTPEVEPSLPAPVPQGTPDIPTLPEIIESQEDTESNPLSEELPEAPPPKAELEPEPTEPTKPTEPTEPTEPIEPTEPTELAPEPESSEPTPPPSTEEKRTPSMEQPII